MERISNDINELRNSAKFEIENFELLAEEKMIAYFSEFPTIAGFPFRMILIEKPDGNIRSCFRQWDTEYDFNRWNKGIYNLDRLRVITEEKLLTESDRSDLMKYLLSLEKVQLPQSLHNEKAIILDGSDWSFGICFRNYAVDYKWRATTDDIELFVPIIELMKNQHATKNKRH